MKKILWLLILMNGSAWSQTTMPALPMGCDTLIKDLYEVISGPAGPRDWERFRKLFHPKAQMGAYSPGQNGQPDQLVLFSPDNYIKRNGPRFEKMEFYEKELGRQTQQFGKLWQILSSYEWHSGELRQRGVNALMLVKDQNQWLIMSIIWETESKESPIPKPLLNKTN
jgi:hypothetical protein